MARPALQPLRIAGPVGELEAEWLPPTRLPLTAAVVCHPLPTAGGSMHNKVVHTISRVFTSGGMGVLRFNTRGAGTSEGIFDHGDGEIDDLASVVAHLRKQGVERLWLAGFSFGSFLAFSLVARHPELIQHIDQLVLVAPPVARFDYTTTTLLPFPVTLLQGDADEVTEPLAVYDWAEHIGMWIPHFDLLRFPDCDHFFHGRLIDLRHRLVDQLALHHPDLFGDRAGQ